MWVESQTIWTSKNGCNDVFCNKRISEFGKNFPILTDDVITDTHAVSAMVKGRPSCVIGTMP